MRPTRPVSEIPRWTLGAALAACEACRGAVPGVTIEWPNDLMHGDRKLGGVLADLRSAGDRPAELVLGLGLNVHHGEGELPEGVRATSLRLAGDGVIQESSFPEIPLTSGGYWPWSHVVVCSWWRR